MEGYVGIVAILDYVGIFFEGWGWLVWLFKSYIIFIKMLPTMTFQLKL